MVASESNRLLMEMLTLLFGFVCIYSGTNHTMQTDVSVNCSFSNEICEYIVSNTSTHFKLFYVLGIDSLGEFIYAILAQIKPGPSAKIDR